MLLLVLAAGAAVGWYVVSPRSAVEELRAAANAGDEAALAEKVAFDSVRAHLKTDLRAQLAKGSDRDDAAATIGAALGGLFVDGLIDLFVSPAGMATVLRGRLPERAAADTDPERAPRDHSIDRRGTGRFLVRFARDGDDARPVLEFRRFGLDWRLVRIRIENE